jgi:dihydrofolate reductase
MTNVYTHMTMSLDGYIADPHDGTGELFDWYGAGDVTVPSADARWSFQVDENSAVMFREILRNCGALVCGRRLFDLTNGWDDSHPIGAPVVVVTHRVPQDAARWPRTNFVDGVAEAVTRAREIAGAQDVCIASADIARQALDLRLVAEVCVSLVPVLLGAGIPYFAGLTGAPHRLDDPVVISGKRAIHLRYPVQR